MTLPAGSIDPENLPVGVFKHDELASTLQDQTKDKYTAVAAGRFPPVVSGTSAGDPADNLGALGFIVDLFGKLSEDVANADPATIQGPEDLHPLITNFFEGLPLIGLIIEVINEISQLFTGEEDGDSDDLSSWVNSVLGRDISLAGRVAAIEGKIAIGAEFFDDFNRGDDDTTLGNGWTQGGAGQPLGIHDQAAQIKRVALPAEGVRYAICPLTASGDDFTVSAVIHPAGVSDYPSTVLYARSDTALTTGICVLFSKNTTRIARYTRSGTTFTYSPILTGDGTKWYSNSATIQFKGSGTTLQVVIDNVLVHTVTDTVHTIGSTRRTVGFSAQCETALLAIPQYSGGLASFAMRSSVTLDAVANTALNAQIAANTASTNAATAVTTANAKTKTTRANAAPSSPGVGDIWIDNTLGDTKAIYNVWDGSAWQPTTDKVATDTAVSVTTLSTGAVLDTFFTNGTWTKRAGVKRVRIHIFGSGGSGAGGGPGANRVGTGGGVGGYTFDEVDASALGATESVTVASSGVAAGSTSPGNPGNSSTFATYSAGGGGGGVNGVVATVIAPGKVGFGNQTAFVSGVGGGAGGTGVGYDGSAGSFTAGGAGGSGSGGGGNTGPTAPVGKIGLGSSGGGGAGSSSSGGNGGGAGPPAGGGGGGGAYTNSGTSGGGGAGGAGRVYIENLYT